MTDISTLSFSERSVLFAKISQLAYYTDKATEKQAKRLGFSVREFYNCSSAQAYLLETDTDIVIACRGTEPHQFADLKADANAWPVVSETISRVHAGFKGYVDYLWPLVEEDMHSSTKRLWFTGHSLGAAMATLMTYRCEHCSRTQNAEELYTYGSPRVGWPKYIRAFNTTHHRWVNNNDIVTRVPFWIMGYRHNGEEHYINAYGNVRPFTGWQRAKDRFRGIWLGIKKGKIDSFSDHAIGLYVYHCESYDKGQENPQGLTVK